MTQRDLAHAKERLAAAQALPEAHPNRAAIIGLWRSEIQLLSVTMVGERAAHEKERRYRRAQERIAVADQKR